jgi:hypothetical protein
MKFTWDARKAKSNLRKHRVSFDEGSTVFNDPLAATIPDPDHSVGENRFVTVGVSSLGRLIVVCYAEDSETYRIISARQATTHERKQYES